MYIYSYTYTVVQQLQVFIHCVIHFLRKDDKRSMSVFTSVCVCVHNNMYTMYTIVCIQCILYTINASYVISEGVSH